MKAFLQARPTAGGLIQICIIWPGTLVAQIDLKRDHTVFNGVALRLSLCGRLGLRLRLGVAHLGQLLEGALVHRLVLGICSGRLLPVALLQRPHVLVVGLHLRFMAGQCWCNDAASRMLSWLPLCSDAPMCRALNLQICQHKKVLLVCIRTAAAMLSHSARRCTSDMHLSRCCSIPTGALAQSACNYTGWRAMPSCRVSACAATRASHELMYIRWIFCSLTVCGLPPQLLDGEVPTRRAALMSSSAST